MSFFEVRYKTATAAASGDVITDQGEASSSIDVARQALSAPAAIATAGTDADEAAGEKETAPSATIETPNCGKFTVFAGGGLRLAAATDSRCILGKPGFNQTREEISNVKVAGNHMNGTPLVPGP